MNREIKFRAWDRNAEGMLFFNFSTLTKNIDPDYDGNVYMQYTGLKDKNGVEIYEGDVLGLEGYADVVVAFYRNMFCYHSSHEEVCDSYPLYELSNTYEVIGNIYENPDLIK